jgi:hypothetical protein
MGLAMPQILTRDLAGSDAPFAARVPYTAHPLCPISRRYNLASQLLARTQELAMVMAGE